MFLARVTGNVVAPVKDSHLAGNRLLVVHPIDLDGKLTGKSLIALSKVDAGEGDTVLVLKEGSGARQLFADQKIPLQAVVVAIVDDVEVHRQWLESERGPLVPFPRGEGQSPAPQDDER